MGSDPEAQTDALEEPMLRAERLQNLQRFRFGQLDVRHDWQVQASPSSANRPETEAPPSEVEQEAKEQPADAA